MEEIAELLGKPHLNDGEVKSITGLYSDLGLSTEYIRTLALYLSESTQKFSIYKLQRKAALLCDKNITDTELLEKYIADQSATNSAEYEFKSVFGGDIWTRSLTPSEKKYCARWWGELGFSAAIVDMARDISIQNTNKVSLAYMNKCLTAWHDAGLTTIEAIMAQREADALARTEAHRPAAAKRGKKATDTPTYADFDTDDALMRALERSYGEDKS
jgi:DnaD/phage-associated family protein